MSGLQLRVEHDEPDDVIERLAARSPMICFVSNPSRAAAQAIIAAAIISGAVVERIRCSANEGQTSRCVGKRPSGFAHRVLGLCHVHRRLGPCGVRATVPLDLGRRLDRRDGRQGPRRGRAGRGRGLADQPCKLLTSSTEALPRSATPVGLCWWDGGPHQLRHFRLCTCIAAGRAQAPSRVLPQQPAVRHLGRWHPVAWMDRLQRRICLRRQRRLRLGRGNDVHRGGCGNDHVGHGGAHPGRGPHVHRCHVRRGGWTCGLEEFGRPKTA